jgi:hypothetical protein
METMMDTMVERDLYTIASALASIANSYQPGQSLADIAVACEGIQETMTSIDKHLVELLDRDPK